MSYSAQFQAHLDTKATTIARAWAVTRQDGIVMGFTDHDRPLAFAGLTFQPETGMSASALGQSSGLSVDNFEVVAALRADAITEDDIRAGRYDGAELRSWLVNWADTSEHALIFRGHLGELTRNDGAFQAELRGLSDRLNNQVGRVYHPACSAVLGDGKCRFDPLQAGYFVELAVEECEGATRFSWQSLTGFEDRWFERGLLTVLDGAAAGLSGAVKFDRLAQDGRRVIELWQSLRAELVAGDRVRIVAGCDRRAETCRLKFDNFVNFRGFPHIPGEDWLVSYPVSGGNYDGGSLFR
ncbi:DUF2163 domain-containing protein [Thioclava sp. GXIMD4216]|uniref:DUF2163 domain-containing protein n=1 Tax=Thioclava litoralis TaxID=3076557 RepID=A0ABZ1E1U7_9RHOB|nr:DUF2163 domain-containing protein [Thioclava sp. FTW29]